VEGFYIYPIVDLMYVQLTYPSSPSFPKRQKLTARLEEKNYRIILSIINFPKLYFQISRYFLTGSCLTACLIAPQRLKILKMTPHGVGPITFITRGVLGTLSEVVGNNMKKEGIYSTRSGYIYIKKEKEFMHTTNI
jgi:hypothetical protein